VPNDTNARGIEVPEMNDGHVAHLREKQPHHAPAFAGSEDAESYALRVSGSSRYRARRGHRLAC
jgi:hypothetical protein